MLEIIIEIASPLLLFVAGLIYLLGHRSNSFWLD
ncbi:MAG: hypothetical protein H6R14_815 [Proteobacteria bacterium]|nr:hypothetical protein [Pseudomonadota bacterium]